MLRASHQLIDLESAQYLGNHPKHRSHQLILDQGSRNHEYHHLANNEQTT